ncbi:Phytochrome [Thalictrum thalictroides]|uniref:Phytochrome n=1 Tax=Thalictrum thalictroides TaxID=46969 RepID=A0A7J6WMJ3_THATH|nr:Phytochrome [Thalictrum thalictroides]
MVLEKGEEKEKTKNTTNSSSTTPKNKAIVQFNADARLLSEFEQSGESGKSFNYSESVKSAPDSVSEQEIRGYLSTIQRGGLIQSFGYLIAIEEQSFTIIAYSENANTLLLGLNTPLDVAKATNFNECLLGVDARTLFTPASGESLARAAAAQEISLLNPIWVHSRNTQKPFYAILHRIDVGIVIDLEPAHSGDPAFTIAGAVQSQKLAVRAISRLQSLPGGDIGMLCDVVVEKVQELTGYDRVMVYKFHEDEHGEVVSEIRRSDLEPYLGLHYPATDIPQAARFLFKQTRVRMICDCQANSIGIVQSGELKRPLCLVNSTLRAPHGCHTQYMTNMGSIASLVIAVVVNWRDQSSLWGLVVCHHTSPRYVSFPLRYACEFLMQAFGLQLNMELQLAAQLAEKNVLKMQTLLCDMLLRDVPFGIVTQSPNIMDLVKCDGAALLYGGKCWMLGVTPTETQIKDITNWLLTCHGDSTGLSTDCLADAGYPGASYLGDAVCGMAVVQIMPNDFLCWFRSHTAKEIKWGGAKHHPADKDDGGKMHPRSSFKAFLEVVKNKSLPWECSEMNAIHSLQLIMRGSLQDLEEKNIKTISQSQQIHSDVQKIEEITSVAFEMVKLIETATTPIFATDSTGLINGWNAKTAELTGLPAKEAIGKSLVYEIVHEDSRLIVENLLSRALRDNEDRNIELKLKTFGLQKDKRVVIIVANSCTSKDYTNNVIGVSFVGQDVTEAKVVLDNFVRLQGDYKAIIHSLNPLIPPIFASDENACCSEWNAAMEKLTGWKKEETIGKMIFGEIFGDFCKLGGQDGLTKFMVLLYRAIGGHDIENFPFTFFNKNGKCIEVLLTANKRIDTSGRGIGCFCFLQTLVPTLQQAFEAQREEERKCYARVKELAYIRQEMKNPLNGILFTHKLMEANSVSVDQKHYLQTSDACERQMLAIIEDVDLRSIEEGSMELNKASFILESVLDAIVSQVMILVTEKNLQLIRKIPEEIKTLSLYGDQIRLQQILANFLLNVTLHAPSLDSWVEIEVAPSAQLVQDSLEPVHLQFRMTHPGKGLPSELVNDMFEDGTKWTSREGLALNMSCKLLKMMRGDVHYVRESEKCYFIINTEFQMVRGGCK